jgi:hypothetical protein
MTRRQWPLIVKFDDDLPHGPYIESERSPLPTTHLRNHHATTTEYVYLGPKSSVGDVRQAIANWVSKNGHTQIRQTFGSIEYKGGELSDEQMIGSMVKEGDRIHVSVTVTVKNVCLIL